MKKSVLALCTLIAASVVAVIATDMMTRAEAVQIAAPQPAVRESSLPGENTSDIDPDLEHVYTAKAAGTLDPSDPAYLRVLQRAAGDFEGRGGHALDQGNDACPAVMIPAIPYFDSGTTAGRADNYSGTCVGAGAPDVIYRFTPTVSQVYTISLCGSSYDTGLYVRYGGACPGSIAVACNDDACGVASQLTVALTGGLTYYIIVDGYTGQSGAYVLTVTGPPPSCTVTCPGGSIAEGEACPAGTDHFNGGCNSSPHVFSPISCGQTVCGRCNTASGIRDTDWYSFVTSSSSVLTWTVRASFNVSALVLNGSCPASIITSSSALACSTLVLTSDVLPAGTYYVVVEPADFNTLACGDYVATLTCSSAPVLGDRCEYPFVVDSFPFCVCGSTADFTDDYAPPANCIAPDSSHAPDVVYRYAAVNTFAATVSLCESDFRSVLHVWEGCPGGTLVECTTDDSSCGLARSSPRVNFIEGVTYFIVVDGLGSASGNYSLRIARPLDDIPVEPPLYTPCTVACPPGGIAELDGGCGPTHHLNDNWPGETIHCGETICGTSWSNASYGDVDFYSFGLTTPQWATIAITAEFPFQAIVFYIPGCS